MDGIIRKTFENKFDADQFEYFIKNLLNDIEPRKNQIPVPPSFKEFIKSYKRIGKYIDPDDNIIDVLIVKLQREASIERARTAQRNFIARYLNGTMDGELRSAALVAFVSEDTKDWRFSLIKMDYKFEETQDGKRKVIQELSAAKRFSFLVGESEACHTAQAQLLPLLKKEKPYLEDLEEAFSVEKVTKEFFEKYKKLFNELSGELNRLYKDYGDIKKDFDMHEVKIEDFAKKLLGQLVFLYFLQKKGWLGVQPYKKWGTEKKNFLRRLFNKEYKDYGNFFNEILEPLFYEALAKDRRDQNDIYEPLNCRIPFLNGGLFDPISDYNWKETNLEIKNEIFNDIFDTFDLYNFTVKEDEPLEKEVAVDPEMLGKVFEGLLDTDERRNTGSYYTPREIVHYMCKESIINYLYYAFNEEIPKEDFSKYFRIGDSTYSNKSVKIELPETIKKKAKEIDNKLQNIKICDPAIGSGAFPVGMMNEIVRARASLTKEIGNTSNRTPYIFKKNLIENSLYGLDKSSGAVEIAMLRFWLSLVLDIDNENPDEELKIEPLPNLDYKIMQGSSIVSHYKNVYLDKLITFKGISEQKTIFDANPDEVDKKIYELKNAKKSYMEAPHKEKKDKLKQEIENLVIDIITIKLKGQSKQNEIPQVIDNIKKQKEKNYFWWHLYFAEVFEQNDGNGGFDIVIGNPPYVKEFTDKSAFDGLRDIPEYYQGKMDLWTAFGSKSIDILAPNGIQCFIAPNNWISNSGASKFRNKVINDTQIIDFIDFGNYKVFGSAAIQTMVYILVKNWREKEYSLNYHKLLNDKATKAELERFLDKNEKGETFLKYNVSLNRNEFKDKFITFILEENTMILDKINREGTFNLHYNEVAQGIVAPQDLLNKKNSEILGKEFKVGDGIFVLSEKEKQELRLTDKEIIEIIRPYYTTEQLGKYYGNSENKEWLIYTASRFKDPKEIAPYPNIKHHLDKFKEIITSDFKPYGLHRTREESFFKGEKIISLRKCSEPTFTYTDFDCYVAQTFFVIKTAKTNQKYLTTILNSKVIKYWLLYKGKMQGNNYQVDKEPLLNIPIMDGNKEIKFLLSILCDYLIILYKYSNQENCSYQAKFFQNIVNGLVYELYFYEDLASQDCLLLNKIKNCIKPLNQMDEKNKLNLINNVFNSLETKDSEIIKILFNQKIINPIKTIEEKLG